MCGTFAVLFANLRCCLGADAVAKSPPSSAAAPWLPLLALLLLLCDAAAAAPPRPPPPLLRLPPAAAAAAALLLTLTTVVGEPLRGEEGEREGRRHPQNSLEYERSNREGRSWTRSML